jgi:hypothetical protein
LPIPVDAPEESGRAQPRREAYEVGWDLPQQPGSEGVGKLASFGVLRSISDLYSVARAAIQLRKMEIRGLGWDIVPTLDAAKAMRGSSAQSKDFGKRRAEALKFFNRPDPDYFTWGSWIDDCLEQMLVYDALSVYIQPKRGKGLKKGLLGSDLDCLQLIDGASIRPLYDLHGATPRPPAPAFQQYLYGVPRSDLTSVITGRDLDEAGMTDAQWAPFRGDQLLYLPMVKRRWSPYGMPPVERALVPIMAGLQKQAFALDYFNSGTVPAVYVSPGDVTMTPNQIRELQDALNAVSGDPAWHHKIIVLPPGSKTMPQRPAELADQFDDVVMNWVCMAFDVQPMELGITPKVSTTVSPGASNQMAKSSQGTHERKATKPTLQYLASIMDFILQEVCQQPDMRFLFEGLEEDEDELTQTNLLATQIGVGLASIDEGRAELGKQPWGLPETSDPGWASPTGGFVPLGQVDMTGAPVAGAQPDAAHPAGAPPAGQAPGQPGGQPGQGAPGDRVPAPRKPGQGGQQGNAGQSPGHDAAEAANDAQQSAAGHGTGSSRNSSSKAAHAELDLLAAHLSEGGRITAFRAVHVPAAALAMISEDLAKGLSVGQAVDVARTVVLGPAEYEWVAKEDAGPPGWPGWDLDEVLARIYEGKLAQAFKAAARAVRQIAASWLSGAGGSVQAAVDAIRQAVSDALGGILQDAWTEGYALGQQAAMAMITETDAVDWGSWVPGDVAAAAKVADADGLADLLSQYGVSAIRSISQTNMDGVAGLLSDALSGGLSSQTLAQQIAGLLLSPSRAQMIAQTEIARAVSNATLDRFSAMNVTSKVWLVAPARACPACLANAAQGAIPVGDSFRSGQVSPPGHPRCRCSLGPGAVGGVDLSEFMSDKSVRVIDLNGQETRRERRQDDAGGYAGGGAANVRPHYGDGRQMDIPGGVPGSQAGGEPPRWDGSEPEPRVATAPDDEDDADYPNARGVPSRPGTYWPAPYMDGYWPQGGIGSAQAGTSSPGGHGPRGRPPNGAGKSALPGLKSVPVDREIVYRRMLADFPPQAIAWIRSARWVLADVPQDLIDDDDVSSWAASHDPGRVARFARQYREDPGAVKPAVMVAEPGASRLKVIDGHHHVLGARQDGKPVRAYVGYVNERGGPWDETHSSQRPKKPGAAKAAVPGLTSRSGMISLDLPPGTVRPAPGQERL